MRKFKVLFIALIIAILSLTCFTACEFLPDIDIVDGLGSLVDDIFGNSSSSQYDECKKGNHEWHYSWTENSSCYYEGREFYYCPYCSEQKIEYLPRLEHEIIKEEGYEADCYNEGFTGNSYCVNCGEVVEYGEYIPATYHQNTVIENKVDVTCTQDGYTGDEVCLDCGAIITSGSYIWSNGHPNTYLVDEKDATCTEYGYSGDAYCTDCGELVWTGYYIDPYHKNVTLVGYKDKTCTEDGYSGDEICNDCGQISWYGDTIPSFGHNNEYVYYQQPTCTQDGYTEGYYCYNCETYTQGHEVIPALGHNEYIYSYGVPATCYSDGWADTISCYRCGNTYGGEYIPAGHTEVIIPASDPTCSSYGYTEGSKCSECGVSINEQTRIDMLNHASFTYVPGYDATCMSNGLTEGYACADCGTPSQTQHSIPATGHVFGADNKCYSCDLVVTDCLAYSLNTYEDGYVVSGFIAGEGSEVSVLVIPSSYEGLPVTGIASYAFVGYENLTKVVIPETVTYVNDYAFYECPALKTIEFKDYAQYVDINYGDWLYGCDGVEISVAVYNGLSPYEVYITAMNAINHNLERYTMTTEGETYMNYYGTSYKAVSNKMVQKQCYDNFYIYKSSTDHMSSPAHTTEETYYYVDSYLYTYIAGIGNAKFYCSPEAFGGLFLIENGDIPELTAKFFKGATFVIHENGQMSLTLVMDEELIAALITDIGNIQADMTVYDCTYSYLFDSDGNIISYTSDMHYGVNDYDYTFNATSTTTFSDVGTLGTIYAPGGYTDYTSAYSSLCTNGHTVVECPEVPATCFGNGKTAHSYCSKCFNSIESYEILFAGHNYYNGECTTCGALSGYSEGLAYVLVESDYGYGYALVGIGDCDDLVIFVPQQIYGRPVVFVNSDAFAGTEVYSIYIGSQYWYIDDFFGCDNATQYWY